MKANPSRTGTRVSDVPSTSRWGRSWVQVAARVALLSWASLMAFILPASAQTAVPAGNGLPEPIRMALSKAGLNETHLAVAVLPLHPGVRSATAKNPGRAGTPALLHQPDRPMQPASAMKVLTSAVGLDRLGPNGRGYTELRTAAPVVEGRLQGDLILVGGADLELGLSLHDVT